MKVRYFRVRGDGDCLIAPEGEGWFDVVVSHPVLRAPHFNPRLGALLNAGVQGRLSVHATVG